LYGVRIVNVDGVNYTMSKKVTDKQKIKALERILRSVMGMYYDEVEILYSTVSKDILNIDLECDVNNLLNIKNSLQNSGIEFYVYDEIFKCKDKSCFIHRNTKGYGSKVNVSLTIETEYWRENEKLKEEIKQLKKELNK
jgi:hypothetical protein